MTQKNRNISSVAEILWSSSKHSKAANRHLGGLDGGLEITITSKVIKTIRNNPKITQKELVAETAIP
jgi:hypothetical protein